MHKTTSNESDFGQLLREAIKERDMLLPKTSLMAGRFVSQRLLGSGGMGAVYEAFDNERDTRVALKILTSVDASSIYRLKQEFRALSDVVHPNLVALHELFTDQGRWFFTMELLPGKTLFDPPVAALDEYQLRSIFFQLATGVQAIHDTGKLHRDLKPTNVMLTPEDRVVILDFGLVSDKEAGGVGQTIIDESISGTPLYMAPEQAAAQPATARSDWYAFGVMLFEALTGKPPFDGSQQQVLMRKQQQDAPRPSSIKSDIPSDLEQLCIGLLQREPKARPGWREIIEVLGPISEPTDSLLPQTEIPFVGRIRELQALREAFEATDQGQPVMVYVHGVSGVGKTALVEWFLYGLQQQGKAVVLTGRCYESESVPFKACDSLIDALSRYLKKLPLERSGTLLPMNVRAIARLFPALQRLDLISKLKQRHPLPRDPSALRQGAFEAFKELLTKIASQEPLVLFVDDLQWSDIDGAKLLSSVLSRPNPPALLLIGAYRSEEGESGVGLTTLRDRIQEFDASEVREIALGELNEEESKTLSRQLLSAERKDRASQIAREAQGSPFFITELSLFASSARDPSEPIGVQEAIGHRLATLDESERQVLQAISVSARPMEQSLLRAITGADDLARALRRLQADRLVRKITSGESNEVTTYHDRIRESVVASMDDSHIKSWHAKFARAIESCEAPDLVALTEHFLGAGEELKAGTCASQAADRAAQSLAFDIAARLYRIALQLNPGDRENQRELQIKLGTALVNAGRGAEAAPILIQAAEGALLEQQLQLRQLAARCWVITGHMTEGKRELDRTLRSVGLKLYSSHFASIVDLMVNRARIKLHGLKFTERQVEEVSQKQLLELEACWTAATGLAIVDPLQSAAFGSRYLRLALQSGIAKYIVLGLSLEAMLRATFDVRYHCLVGESLNLARQLCQKTETPEMLVFIQVAEGVAALVLGELPRAKKSLERAEKTSLQVSMDFYNGLSYIRNFLSAVYPILGCWKELQEQWDTWIKDAQERNDLNALTNLRIMTGTYRYLAVDQVDKAREQIVLGLSQWPGQDFDIYRWSAGRFEALIERYVGDHRKAFDILEDISKRFSRSLLRKVQYYRVVNSWYLAQAALGLASTVEFRTSLLKIARQQVRKLTIERFPFTDSFIPYLRASIAYLEGDEDNAVRLLREAVTAYQKAQYKLFEAATNQRLGRLVGGDEGRTLVAQADQTMRQEGIVRPDRITAVLAPGFPD